MHCSFCNKECKNVNSLKNHARFCKSNPDRTLSPFETAKWQESRQKSNQHIKGTAKPLTVEDRRLMSEQRKSQWTPTRRRQQSEKMKAVMSEVVKTRPESYSYNNFCGRSKKTWYKDQWMHSQWELDVAKWLDQQNITWTRKVRSFSYLWQGKEKQYFPDFYLEQFDLYIEVKGYQTLRDVEKWKAVDNLLVLKQKEIEQIRNKQFTLAGYVS